MESLQDSVAVVTGAARGIGLAIAREFASRGAKVALVDRLAEEARASAAGLAAGGAAAFPFSADVTVPAQIEAAVARIEAEIGPIRTLVNNAGTFSTIGPVWELDPDAWFRDTRVNLFGAFNCCRYAVARMVERRHGRVVNIVSGGGVGDPHPHSTGYACSKTALMRLTEGLAAESREFGLSVFAVAPGAIRTAMTEYILESPEGRTWRPTFKDLFANGRDGDPGEVARLCADLAQGKADFLSGRYIHARTNLDEAIARRGEILEKDLWTLRIRKSP
ncbi:MAG: 4-formylbenzenesulfonate dehydrogenase TsaC1/TsaC2 [candidate division BRC1 bacterium ADurb.BinA364]|nr:MAG: 4-formylbenzenesulfonate dehydrogenase TsaC1/TsaC2 [candidate division BRC1 bacterium ADurb.BinA364]